MSSRVRKFVASGMFAAAGLAIALFARVLFPTMSGPPTDAEKLGSGIGFILSTSLVFLSPFVIGRRAARQVWDLSQKKLLLELFLIPAVPLALLLGAPQVGLSEIGIGLLAFVTLAAFHSSLGLAWRTVLTRGNALIQKIAALALAMISVPVVVLIFYFAIYFE